MSEEIAVVVPWIDEEQLAKFAGAWSVTADSQHDGNIVWMHDVNREGCATMKNRGVALAVSQGADIVVVLDDDCYPSWHGGYGSKLFGDWSFTAAHREALAAQPVEMFLPVTEPWSRGTPFTGLTVKMPVAASMGFWEGIGDYDAPRQIVHGGEAMTFYPQAVHGRYFALSGMNVAFRPKEWLPWCSFIDVPRYDDIWMGWLWQKEAYRRGACFNLRGPNVEHARQSNVWRNLKVEAQYMEQNEDTWKAIAISPLTEYADLLGLLPEHQGGSDR